MEMEFCLKEENPAPSSPLALRSDGRKLTRCPRLELVNAKTIASINESCKQHRIRDVVVGGAVRVKIVVTKQQLKQLMAASNATKLRSNNTLHTSSIEHLLHAIKKKVETERTGQTGRRVRWRPDLQSIPEEK